MYYSVLLDNSIVLTFDSFMLKQCLNLSNFFWWCSKYKVKWEVRDQPVTDPLNGVFLQEHDIQHCHIYVETMNKSLILSSVTGP